MKRILSLCLIFCLSFSISAFAIEPMSFVGGSEFVYAKSFNSYGIALAGVDANLDGIFDEKTKTLIITPIEELTEGKTYTVESVCRDGKLINVVFEPKQGEAEESGMGCDQFFG